MITGLYSFRLLFLVFFGGEGSASPRCKDANNKVMTLPLLVLTALALLGGLLAPPLQSVFGAAQASHPPIWVEAMAIAMPIIGLAIACWFFLYRRHPMGEASALEKEPSALEKLWFGGWGFDWLYDQLLVRPFVFIAQANRDDIVDSFYKFTAAGSRRLNSMLSHTQNGQVRWYLASLVCGSILFLGLLVAL